MYDEDDDDSSKKSRALNRLVSNAEKLYEKALYEVPADINQKIFGKCAMCKSFMFAESEFSIIYAKCEVFERELRQKQPITKCSRFEEIGSLSLWDMKGIAVLIDKPNRIIGFLGEEEDEERPESEDAPTQG